MWYYLNIMNKVYIVSCADWTTISEGRDSESAATKAFEKMMKLKGEELKVTPIMETTCYSDITQDFDLEQYKEAVYCPRVMSNAGFHDTSKSFKNIIENENVRN